MLPLTSKRNCLERDKRIELSSSAWKAGVIPLYESRQGLVRLARIELARPAARDFKSLVSTYFTTVANLAPRTRLERVTP